ncbi:MAG TPA: Uma2 family endonuclease [Fimbriiglobus sp.]|nr:Uma2 family endonuclease [Fimbriiglobus sp.]
MATTATHPFTTADLLAMPDDGRRRWLIRGELREQEVTIRNRFHSIAMARLTGVLYVWRSAQPAPRGEIICGEAGVRLPGEPETTVGVDVAYVPQDVVVRQSSDTTLVEGVPTLIVEILSPSDKLEEIDEMIAAYQAAGVPLVWVVDPRDRTVTIYRPGEEPTFANARQDLDGGDVLPGFRVPVAQLFE